MAMRELSEDVVDRRWHVVRCALRGDARENVGVIKAYMGKGVKQKDLLEKAIEVYAELLGFSDGKGYVRLVIDGKVCLWRVPR